MLKKLIKIGFKDIYIYREDTKGFSQKYVYSCYEKKLIEFLG